MFRERSVRETGTASDQKDIVRILRELYVRTRHLLARNSLTLKDSQVLAERISLIRALLATWEELERKAGRAERFECIQYLKTHYSELEGIVKEIRNDRLD